MDVSVVVPVYNPGANLDPCLHAVLAQTLPADRYEIVLVDDGCTDGTSALLDVHARAHPDRVRVFHEPASGWPGRPRNVGVQRARGEFVQFVDNDDVLGPGALARMLDAARACDADIVLGKMSSDFRGINHDIYRDNRLGVTIADFPLVESLTPHKMFRRQFLLDHDVRFAEGPLHLEDQQFCMHAYVHASSVAVVADEQCYFYKRRSGFGSNAGDIPADPDDYYRDLERVFDIVDVHVPPDRRPRLYERFYRVEMLGRLRDQAMLDYDPDYRKHLFNRVRRLAEDRVPGAVESLLPHFAARQSELLRSRDLEGMLALAAQLAELHVRATVESLRWEDGRLSVTVTASLSKPVDVSVDADPVLVARDDSSTWFVDTPMSFRGTTSATSVVTIDPTTALGGKPLRPGLWDIRLRTHVGGLTRTARLNRSDDEADAPSMCLYDGPVQVVAPYWTSNAELALDVEQWARSVTAQVARAARGGAAGTWSVPSVVATGSVVRDADLFVDGRRVAGRLRAGPEGATLETALTAGSEWWVRVGPPGTSAPERLSR